ncbi:MAG TPA: Holliday junction resolvase RuvX [Bacteroidia bacterium]|nr:Holliday junction resolvase RuvX [Bacteroidia bacterium]
MARILAIDFGTKRVGIAVTDELQLIATALTTVHANEILDFLNNYLKTEKVECIVVGEPKQMNNTPSQSAQAVEAFVKQLKKKFSEMKIERIDERFTSKMALRTMIDGGSSKKDRRNKETIDKMSATIILQSYMESKNFKHASE